MWLAGLKFSKCRSVWTLRAVGREWKAEGEGGGEEGRSPATKWRLSPVRSGDLENFLFGPGYIL